MPHSAELAIDSDFSVVNLVEGENFKPEFLKLVSGSRLFLYNPPIDLEACFAEPQCHASYPYPWRKIIHEHRRCDQLSSDHLIGKGCS